MLPRQTAVAEASRLTTGASRVIPVKSTVVVLISFTEIVFAAVVAASPFIYGRLPEKVPAAILLSMPATSALA